MGLAGVINDLHIPFHDSRAINLAISVFKDVGIDTLYINGDLVDFYAINFHGPKHPIVGSHLEDEISQTRLWLKRFKDELPGVDIHYVFGNHEHRLERFMLAYAKALYGYVSLDKLLELDRLKIKWTPYNQRVRVLGSDVFVQHSPPSYGKSGSMTSLEKDVDQTTIYGCTHREQKSTRTGKSGQIYYCYFNGWLGSTSLTPEHTEVFSYAKGHDSWQQCFALVGVDKGQGFVEQVSVQNHKCVYGGYVFYG